MVRVTDGRFYTGITTDLQRRLKEHKHSKKGAKFFRSARPVRVIFVERHANRAAATRREQEIKRMSRVEKLQLIEGNVP